MSTGNPSLGASRPGSFRRGLGPFGGDPAEVVALVLRARRSRLLRAHGHRLRREDLEDCLSQAALEMVARARGGTPFASVDHVANALEQRFLSRIHDRRRALAGRSVVQSTFERALAEGHFGTGEEDVPDRRVDLERRTILRHDLARAGELADRLSADQRLVIASQLAQIECAEFCARFGWSAEKYRKVAQRGRARLRELMEAEERRAKPRAGFSKAGVPFAEAEEPRARPQAGFSKRGVPLARESRIREQGPTYADHSPHS